MQWIISWKKIIEVFENVQEIHFLNQYKFNDEVLTHLIEQINDKNNKLKKVSFIYYNYINSDENGKPTNSKIFYDPDKLKKNNIQKLNDKNWIIKHKASNTGYKIRVFEKTIIQ